jgi:ApaG protein
MHSIISDKVEISTETFYQGNGEYDGQLYHVFAYRITIFNSNPYDIQLLSREWTIYDSLADTSHIEGEGVIGNTPIIHSGEKFQYVSGCNLISEFGKMEGFYNFENLTDHSEFSVPIPAFCLTAPYRYN